MSRFLHSHCPLRPCFPLEGVDPNDFRSDCSSVLISLLCFTDSFYLWSFFSSSVDLDGSLRVAGLQREVRTARWHWSVEDGLAWPGPHLFYQIPARSLAPFAQLSMILFSGYYFWKLESLKRLDCWMLSCTRCFNLFYGDHSNLHRFCPERRREPAKHFSIHSSAYLFVQVFLVRACSKAILGHQASGHFSPLRTSSKANQCHRSRANCLQQSSHLGIPL